MAGAEAPRMIDRTRWGVAVFDHNHQPHYGMLAPWARLKCGIYLDGLKILELHPGMRKCMTFTPALLYQLEAYRKGEIDNLHALCQLDPTSTRKMSLQARRSLLDEVAKLESARIESSLRLRELIREKAGLRHPARTMDHLTGGEAKALASSFTPQEIIDIQTLVNLVCMGHWFTENDAEVGRLWHKGRDFTIAERNLVLRKSIELTRLVLDEIKVADADGRIEVAGTAEFHPILPALAGATDLYEGLRLGGSKIEPYDHPEDAEAQIVNGLDYLARFLGRPMRTFFFPEMAVSVRAMRILEKCAPDIQVVLADDPILLYTLKKHDAEVAAGRKPSRHDEIECRDDTLWWWRRHVPWKFGRLKMLFRIREASSKISFGTEQTYWHLIEREVAGARWMFQQAHRYDAAIPPLLRLYGWDGENQAYNFQDFRWGDTLHLHELLTGAQEFHVELPGEFVARFPDPLCPVLDDFVPGSWGDEADCRVWVGGEAHNAVFRILKDVRARLEEAQAHGHPNHGGSRAQTLALAWKEFHAACGSDFLWVISQRGGYGAVPVPLFSEIFVRKLTSALKLAGAKTPKSLLEFSRKTGYEDPLFTPPQRR